MSVDCGMLDTQQPIPEDPMTRRPLAALVVLASAGLLLAGCAAPGGGGSADADSD
jgi:hypothetical protein